jgi:putative nucleotidyltransferase with HDIG domain
MNQSKVLKKVQSINNLPVLPEIALRINQKLENMDTSIQDLVDLLEKDQSLVMKILKLVNSSFYGLKSKVQNLPHAVTLLGYNTIRNAVVTVSIMDVLKLKNELAGFKIESLWLHSIQTAVLGKKLSTKIRLTSPDDTFTAGLLHDIGKIVLANYYPNDLLKIIEEMRRRETTFYEAEKALKMCNHAVIGSKLAEHWSLPPLLVDSIKYHHQLPQNNDYNDLLLIVQLADSISHILSSDKGYNLDLENGPTRLRDIVSTIRDEGEKWIVEVKYETDMACSFFNKG